MAPGPRENKTHVVLAGHERFAAQGCRGAGGGRMRRGREAAAGHQRESSARRGRRLRPHRPWSALSSAATGPGTDCPRRIPARLVIPWSALLASLKLPRIFCYIIHFMSVTCISALFGSCSCAFSSVVALVRSAEELAKRSSVTLFALRLLRRIDSPSSPSASAMSARRLFLNRFCFLPGDQVVSAAKRWLAADGGTDRCRSWRCSSAGWPQRSRWCQRWPVAEGLQGCSPVNSCSGRRTRPSWGSLR